MQTYTDKIKEQKFLIFSLFAIGFGVVISNIIGEDESVLFGNWAFVPVTSALVILSVIMAVRNRFVGSQGKAWVLFAIMATCWFIAEMVWITYELFLEIDPYPSEADFFWLLGYPFYFGFLIFYMKPFKKVISKKMVVGASLASIALLVPSLYIAYDEEMEINDMENILGISYPLADTVVLAPALIGVMLFFKGKVNFLWTLMCLGIFCDIIADTGFLFTTLEESYYTGHPIEILYLWSYILFSFGVNDHIKILRVKKEIA